MVKGDVQKWLTRLINDPIVKILAKNSNLTIAQLETILIDFLASNLAGKPLKNEDKARFRLTRSEVSRGAFNRTLKQAKRNIIQSMYTVILLGYLGMFSSTRLDPYLEAAGKLQHYVTVYRDTLSNDELADEQLRMVTMLREELEGSLKELSATKALSEA